MSSELRGDSETVESLLWEYFPDFQDVFEEFIQGQREIAEGVDADWRATIGAWRWISEVFNWEILKPALAEDGGDELVQRVSAFLEELLKLHRRLISEAIEVRVVDHLLGYPAYWQKLRPMAGPLLTALVSDQERYYR